jgi:hypothetical protein
METIIWSNQPPSFWQLIRYYCSLRGNEQKIFIDKSAKDLAGCDSHTLDDLHQYLTYRKKRVGELTHFMRTEKDAKKACDEKGIKHGVTKTKNQTHHQSSKSTVSLVDHITKDVCNSLGVDCDTKPHSRCYWKDHCGQLHVTVRNLDGAVPTLANPYLVWEIKEYWGTSKGGSKMSDAVYECELVGKEIRDFELKIKKKIYHVVFLDGKKQWEARQSDLARFVDLESQGIIDYLLVGQEIENKWECILKNIINLGGA